MKTRLLVPLLVLFLIKQCIASSEHTGEKIIYTVSPFGVAEYNDLGSMLLDGVPVNVSTLKTQALGFRDLEKIYSVQGSLSPVKVERDVKTWLDKEYIEEKYDAQNYTLTIEKFKRNKIFKTYFFKADAPICNPILLLFYLRQLPDVDIGWTLDIRIPEKFQIQMDRIEEVVVPAGKFMAYHFKSIPDKFEIWISKDKPRIPLKLVGRGGLGYAMVIWKYTPPGIPKKDYFGLDQSDNPQ